MRRWCTLSVIVVQLCVAMTDELVGGFHYTAKQFRIIRRFEIIRRSPLKGISELLVLRGNMHILLNL